MSHRPSPVIVDCPCPVISPVPETINVLNCDGSATPTTFPTSLERVVFVQDKPLLVCFDDKDVTDFEVGCSDIDGRTIILVSKVESGVYTQSLIESDSLATPVTDGSKLVHCGRDYETTESCYQLISDPSVKYRRITIIDTTTLAIASTLWIDDAGAGIATPSGVEPCLDRCVDVARGVLSNWG